ncbi:MFS transporter [Pandoraea communis]|uniref:Major facilitator superfamily (MFS) profile domain-containing protein n=1 Tax=Pandoraea communis TaxID=2508297 RepID=A0A5E4TIH8_9BURK|nr:MFS transporter [Pandoraea communis]MDM8354845.1 MFS transporter [Pandoraea communis]VVD86288.1 hypothetical protein PCO31111_01390 [Pandoraea communis]
MADNPQLPTELRRWRILALTQAALGPEIFSMAVLVLFFLRYAGFSFAEFSTFTAALFVLNWILEVPAGALADRFGRKRCLILGNLIYCAAMLLLIAASSRVSLILIALMYAVGGSLASGTFQAMMYEAFASRDAIPGFHAVVARSTGLSLWSAAAAAAIGGWLAGFSLVLPLIVDVIVLAGLTLFLLWGVPAQIPRASFTGDRQTVSKLLGTALRAASISRTWCLLALGCAITFACVRASFNTYQPLMLDAGIPVEYFGVTFSALIVLGGIAANLFSSTSKHWLDRGVIDFAIAGLFAAALAPSIWHSASPIFLLIGIAAHQLIRGIFPSYYSYRLNREIPEDLPARTTMLSLANLVRALLTALAVYAVGALTQAYDFSSAYRWINAAALCALTLLIITTRWPQSHVAAAHTPND